jgi:outer membrane protein OmpU
MKKLLIATTALVATAGMASADITISGHAAAGVYSSLSNKDGHGKITAAAATKTKGGFTYIDVSASSSRVITVADGSDEVALGAGDIVLAGTNGQDAQAADVGTYSGDGIYSNAGVDFTMTGATDNGISFSASVNIDAGMEIDAGDFELDGKDGGTAGLGSVSMSGTFGTLTFDDGGIENLYSDTLSNADVTYATTVGAVSLTIAHDTAAGSASANSVSAGYSASGMDFTLTASEATGGTSSSLAVSYALNDTVTITGETDQAATKESVQTIGASTTLNGVSVSVSSANNSTWDVDLGYTAGGFALTYGVDETDGWTATATAALGGGATFAAGVNDEDSMYAGVSFAF